MADEGLSGTSLKKRAEFNRMIAACKRGRIDMILTKSTSRFARNTVDCLKVIRTLKDRGIAIIFEKENINTLLSSKRNAGVIWIMTGLEIQGKWSGINRLLSI